MRRHRRTGRGRGPGGAPGAGDDAPGLALRRPLLIAMVAVLAVLAAGCLGDEAGSGPQAPGPDEPRNASGSELPDEITGLENVGSIEAEDGRGVEVRDGYAYVAATSGFYIVDLSDPTQPETVSTFLEATSRYVDLLSYPDRTVAVLSGANQEEMYFVNVTNVTTPKLLSTFSPDRTVHSVTVIPGTHLVYNNRGVGDPVEPGIDIIDVSDPANPELVERWPLPRTSGTPKEAPGCATVKTYPKVDLGVCPAVSQTYLLNLSDPEEPEVISTITNPAINVHHWPAVVNDHETLLIADWASASNAPTCGGSDQVAGQPTSTPAGAIWAYDISDMSEPAPTGYVSAPTPSPGQATPCVVHTITEVADRPVVAASWHNGGVVLVNASDPMAPRVVDQWIGGHEAWYAAYADGYVVSGAKDAGIDVLELT